MRLNMRLKKTLFAMVSAVAAASMVLPNVYAGKGVADILQSERHQRFISNRNLQDKYQGRTSTPKSGKRVAPIKKDGPQLAERIASGDYTARPAVTGQQFEDHASKAVSKKSNGNSIAAKMAATNPGGKLTVSQRELDAMNISHNNITETSAQRKDRLNAMYKARSTKGVARAGGVLPSRDIPEGSAFSTMGYVGFSAQNAGDNSSFLLGDQDGMNKLERDFDNLLGGNPGLLNRTGIDRKEPITQGELLPDEIYTDLAVSGHIVANGFFDVNVFYTGTNKGFLAVETDDACDGDLLADGAEAVFSVQTDILGAAFSPRAAITGIAVEQDSEFDGDFASDEIVWFTVFDPDFGVPSNAASALCFAFDTDGNDIPDTAALYRLSFDLIASSGVAVDSFGNVYWQVHDNVVGEIFREADRMDDGFGQDRFPDSALPDFMTLDADATTTLDLVNTANSVDMTIDRNDTIYLQVPGSDNPFVNIDTGLPNHIATYRDRCGAFDPLTGLFPRPDGLVDNSFGVYAASSADGLPTTQGGGTGTPAALIIPEMIFDFSGYSGITADYDDNIYVAVGAEPAGLTNQSPNFGFILQLPDHDCNGVGDVIDRDGSAETVTSVDEFGQVTDYLWAEAPQVPATRTPIGIDGIDFGPLFSLNRVGLSLGDDDAVGFAFDDFDGDFFYGHGLGPNVVAGGSSDLVRDTSLEFPDDPCTDTVISPNPNGGPVGFEFLFCNTAWTGFRLSSNGYIVFEDDPTSQAQFDGDATDNSPTVPEFLSGPPRIAPAWTDLDPSGNVFFQGIGFSSFSVSRMGFASVDAFIIQYINFPQFALEGLFLDANGDIATGNINSFDITLYDDQDSWDDINAEYGPELDPITGECEDNPEDNTPPQLLCQDVSDDDAVNNDNDGSNAYVAVSATSNAITSLGSHPAAYNGRLVDRNGDGDLTDENIAEATQEGVGRTLPEQGPFSFRYHIMELFGDPAVGSGAVIVGFSTGGNVGAIPPGLCETNLSQAAPAADAPFMPLQIGMGTEPEIYELFNDGVTGGVDPVTGIITPSTIDFDLSDVDTACLTRPGRFLDQTFASCLNFKGSNQPIGLFCQSIDIADTSANDDPFTGPTTFTISGFAFPMPTNGVNTICPNAGGGTVNLTRNGKTVTYSVMFLFDEDGDGDIDSMFTFTDPDVVVTNENSVSVTVDFSGADNVAFCGGAAAIKLQAVITPADDNKYTENGGDDPVTLTCISNTDFVGFRAPIVTSIAPDEEDCTSTAEDVQINGLCFFGDITQVFLTTNPDGTGTRIDLTAVTNPNSGTVNAVVNPSLLTPDTDYYVFVVRADGARSTSFPNALGITVTFHCNEGGSETPQPEIVDCEVNRRSGGVFVLTVLFSPEHPAIPGNTVILLDGQQCRKNKYPQRFRQSDGTTLGINCSGGIKKLLPATVTSRNADGTLSSNSRVCNF